VGSEQLLAALRQEGERRAGEIREEAEVAAARLRSEAAARLALLREEHAREQARAIEAEMSAVLAEAERAARGVRLAGAQRLAARLFDLALALLPALRDGEYPELFARLAGALPPREWGTLRVNPADRVQAQTLFARARIETDPAISGGLEAWAQGGELQVVDTLEKRLERGWPEMLPLLLREVENSG
jgi:V/A-type H+/Na+-transporting ATPase subunit E